MMTIYLYSAHRAVIFAIAQLSCYFYRHRVDAFLRLSKRCAHCHPDLPTFNELLEESDDQLFHKLCSNTGRSLHYLLPPPTTASQHGYRPIMKTQRIN